jgi:hypothetical protein
LADHAEGLSPALRTAMLIALGRMPRINSPSPPTNAIDSAEPIDFGWDRSTVRAAATDRSRL